MVFMRTFCNTCSDFHLEKIDIYSVKAKSPADNMSQRCNDNTKRPKLKKNLQGILKI